ncbi:DUF2971 domain-containing protein [Engelhardtia mirabilis]|uniref:DUF2971 domain-containing protein n=1 Tax=Engelhardtia mirabilis TaxID=2528011 RepID=A0A518BH39_9BACT|nr:hypothetical protein Pla133_12990 [Planctomycetes bacterium Pla133]QDV00560.1 hypothetical protein Pla86_12990 [Planctomycetes bacterium Pla86]
MLSEHEQPPYLYRFLDLSTGFEGWLSELLLARVWRLRPLAWLNDAYEGQFTVEQPTIDDGRRFIERHLDPDASELEVTDEMAMTAAGALDQGRNQLVASLRKHAMTGVASMSLSESHGSAVLWSLYAGGHSGIAIRVRTGVPSGLFETISQVQYSSAPPRLESDVLVRDRDSAWWQQTIYRAFTTKSAEWSYEREWRVLFSDESEGRRDADIWKCSGEGEISSILIGVRAQPAIARQVYKLAQEAPDQPDVQVVVQGVDDYALSTVRVENHATLDALLGSARDSPDSLQKS